MQETDRRKTARSRTSSGDPGRGWTCLRSAFEAFRKRKWIVLASFLIVAAALCGLQYYKSLYTAGTVLSLDYEEASNGLTPNRTWFNIYEIRSREVMERLIAYAGLEGEITPDELSRCVRVKATHGKNVSGSVNYISTSFIVKFTSADAVRKRSPEEMLSLLCKSYREYFAEHYGYNHTILSFNVDDLKFSDEYLMKADLLELKCSQLEKFVQLRKRESKNYQDPGTGITFSALEQRVNNFYSYDLARLRSYIIENSIASDRAGLDSMLDYKIRMDSLMHNKMMAAYDEDNKGVKMYDAAMSAVVMIPTQDEQKQYYMSRTKTGMDNMVKHAQEQLTGTAEHMEHIEYNTYLTEKLKVGTAGKTEMEKADAMIKEMEGSLDKIASDIQTVDSGYLNTKARNFISISSDSTGFAEQIGLVSSLLGAALMLIVTFIVVALRIFFSDKEMTA